MTQFDRITHKVGVTGGKACIRGLRVTVATVIGQIGAGHTIDEVLADCPYLEHEDILRAVRYAPWLADDREVVIPGLAPGHSSLTITNSRSCVLPPS